MSLLPDTKEIREYGLEPGRLLTQPRGCKPRTSTSFVTGAEMPDVGAGEPSKTLPAPTALRPSGTAPRPSSQHLDSFLGNQRDQVRRDLAGLICNLDALVTKAHEFVDAFKEALAKRG